MVESQQTTDIAIIGGGMVGASLALLLARVLPQKQIVLLEAQLLFAGPDAASHSASAPDQLSFDRRSSALSPTSADLFDELGLWSGLRHQASPIEQIDVSDRGHFGAARFNAADNGGKPLGYVVPNSAIGHSLLERLQATPNIELCSPVEVSRLTPLRGGMQVVAQRQNKPYELRAELVVVADGAGSPLAAALGVGSRTRDYGQCAIIANVAFEQPHKGRAFERFTTNGPLALLPLAGAAQTESALVWTRPLDMLPEVQAWSDETFLQVLQQEFGHRLGHFTRVSRRSVYPLSLQLAEEQVRSSLVLMGNAAHFLHPVAGQGFNLALRDAARLAQLLASGAAAGKPLGSLGLLQEYERQQKNDQLATVSLSDSFIRIFAARQPAVIAGRNLGLVSLELVSGWREAFLAQMAGRSQPRARLSIAELE